MVHQLPRRCTAEPVHLSKRARARLRVRALDFRACTYVRACPSTGARSDRPQIFRSNSREILGDRGT